MKTQGIEVLCSRSTREIRDDRVVLDGGEEIYADFVIVAAGVVPEIALAARMGLETARGILVDDSLRTSVPGVWAVGECAQHRGVVVGLVAPALAMARAAGADIAGVPKAYLPGPVATKLKVAGIDLFCSGELEGDDEVVVLDTRAGHYRRDVYRGTEVVGTIVLGDPPAVSGAGEVDPMVCACNGVTRSTILASGESTVEGVRAATRASTGCGGCTKAVQALLDEAAEVGFQAVQLEAPKAIEVLVRRPVEVR